MDIFKKGGISFKVQFSVSLAGSQGRGVSPLGNSPAAPQP
jgi:hypothetical protein